MERILIREGAIYALILIAAALAIHPDILEVPGERLASMTERDNYFHPLAYGGILYLIVALARRIVSLIGKFFHRKSRS